MNESVTLTRRLCRLPCMFLGICPCSPCDRVSPRDSESTLGSMTALLSRWWARAAPPAREEHQRLSKTPSKRPKQILCVCVCAYKTPALLLGVVHARCKFIRVVFAATKMLLFKPECASCQELHASPSSAPLYLRSSNGSSLLCLRRTDTAWANQRCVRCASVTRMSNQNRARESAPPLAPANNGDKLN